MNDKTGGYTGKRAGALAVMAAVTVLVTGCSIVHVHFGSSASSSGSVTYQAALGYARCMRAHGLPGFPIPRPSEHFSVSQHFTGNPDSAAGRANDACKHLLSASR